MPTRKFIPVNTYDNNFELEKPQNTKQAYPSNHEYTNPFPYYRPNNSNNISNSTNNNNGRNNVNLSNYLLQHHANSRHFNHYLNLQAKNLNVRHQYKLNKMESSFSNNSNSGNNYEPYIANSIVTASKKNSELKANKRRSAQVFNL